LQRLNPFRIILKLTYTPLRLLLFFGHLISIGVSADRLPGIPEIVSAILGIISEGFEDLHYFIGDFFHTKHKHHGTKDLIKERFAENGHNHDEDIPTRVLRFLFTPLFYLAALWDHGASHFVDKEREPLSFIKLLPEAELSLEKLLP